MWLAFNRINVYPIIRIYNAKIHNRVVYGHVHLSKTSGTTLNGELAARFERVCGHKGYSYDSYQANLRHNQTINGEHVNPDVISRVAENHSRFRIPSDLMEEIGFEDCDYVSHEKEWQFWPDSFQDWDVPMELHIPCRDPISHLMSMCNYKGIKFNCSGETILEVDSCMMDMDRFSMKLVHSYSNIHAKCFTAQSIDEYLHYMDSRLQRKRKEAKYIFRATNGPRNKESECIWKDQKILDAAKEYMLSHFEYYQYCSSCIGSENDLLPSEGHLSAGRRHL
jgi:hypothetical protein